MSLFLLIVLGIPLVALAGQVVGAVAGFVLTLLFHSVRGLFRYVVIGVVRKAFAKKELNEPTP